MLALLLAGLLQASPPAQQLFDQATAAIDAGRYADAGAILQPLVARLSASPKSAGLALARLRLGEAQQGQGQLAEAVSSLRAAVAAGSALDAPALKDEKVDGLIRLASIEQALDDTISAQSDYDAAAKLSTDPMARANALGSLAKLSMFDDSTAALSDAQEAVALVDKMPTISKDVRGSYHVILRRVLLNAGRFAEAGKELDVALQLFGGLTNRTTVISAMARGDLAIAYMLQGQDATARKYLAYTGMGGAGYEGGPFSSPADNQPPPCGEETGIRPDDMAIIEFRIGEDGAVSSVQPIYATRHGPMAQSFARAVSNWSWNPDDAKKIKPFYREAARVELRCAATSERPYMLSVADADVRSWLSGKGIDTAEAMSDEGDARAYPRELAALSQREAVSGPASPTLIPVLNLLLTNRVAPPAARGDAATRAEAIARSAKAPATVVAYFAVYSAATTKKGGLPRVRERLAALAADPLVAGDPRARALVGLSLADLQSYRERLPLLQKIADDPALAPTDVLHVGALTRLASAQARSGDLAAAQAAYARTGLSDQACAVVDARPIYKGATTDGSMFPVEAMEWGFEGWAVTNFDIAADGHTRNVRAVIAYPPLVFGNAAVKVVNTAHFTQTYRPNGGVGCSGEMRSTAFRTH